MNRGDDSKNAKGTGEYGTKRGAYAPKIATTMRQVTFDWLPSCWPVDQLNNLLIKRELH